MDAELTYLALSAGLCAILWVPYVLARVFAWGLMPAMGYPKDPPALPDWAQRSYRAHMNMVENLAVFAALVLVAKLAGVTDDMVGLGALLFFWARVAHAIVFVAGIPVLRTLAFVVSWVGLLLIFVAVIGAPAAAG
ncbi:MAG: MAPEG family protein [Alphaproteobacteria bacterium]